jgi:translation elongation factor EF-G
LGELHLEIVRDKLIEDGLKVKLGNLKISYKETIGDIAGQSLKIKNELKNGNAE